MNSVISHIVEMQLLSSRSVALPGIGVLSIERRSAEITEDGRGIYSPYDYLAFNDQYEEIDEVQEESFFRLLEGYIQQSASMYRSEDAKLHYNNWMQGVLNGESQVIDFDGICSLTLYNGGEILGIDEHFDSLLLKPSNEVLPLYAGSIMEQEQELPQQAVYAEQPTTVSQPTTLPVEQNACQQPQNSNKPQLRRVNKQQAVPRTSAAWVVIAIVLFLAAIGYLVYSLGFIS